MIRTIRYAVAAACVMLVASSPVLAEAPQEMPSLDLHDGMRLGAVLERLNAHGLRIVYSSALVLDDMQLRAIPHAAHVDEFLRELLAPWHLAAVRENNGDWLIVRDPVRTVAVPPASPDALETVDVTASRFGLATSAGTAVFLDRNDVERIPHLADDSVRLLKLLPGVTGGDYSAALNIRGGRRDETMLLIDGAEIHNGFHFRDVDGALSVLDTHLVQSIDFMTGGMTADYGNYMSGVVDLSTFRPSPQDEYHNMLGISFVSAYGRTGHTFAEGRGSWLAAARRGYLDLVLEHAQPDGERLSPRFSDVFAALDYDFTADTSLSAHLLLGSDDLEFITRDDKDDVDSAGKGQSGHFWVTLDHAWSDSLRTRSLLSVASMEQTRDSRGTDDERTGDVVSDFDFRFIDFRQDWSWDAGARHLARFGVNANRHEASYDYHLVASVIDPGTPDSVIDILRDTDLDVSATKFGAYASWRSRLTRSLTAEAGIRWDGFRYPQGMNRDVVSPRVNVLYAFGERGELRAAWGVMHQMQGIDQLQVEDGVADFFPPERSTQSVLSYTQQFSHGISARMDIYDKEYSDLRPRFENALDSIELIPEATIDRIRIDAASAQARGIELTLRRKADLGFSGWVSAAFAHARDRLNGAWVSRSWEQERTVSFGIGWAGALWSLNVAGVLHSGTPTTQLTAGVASGPEGDVAVVVPGEYNSARFGSYTRIDLRANRDVQMRAGKLSYYLEVMNLFDSKNPCCVEDYGIDPRNTSRLVVEDSYWMPRLPSIGFQWEF